jgi:hypothetical protein
MLTSTSFTCAAFGTLNVEMVMASGNRDVGDSGAIEKGDHKIVK